MERVLIPHCWMREYPSGIRRWGVDRNRNIEVIDALQNKHYWLIGSFNYYVDSCCYHDHPSEEESAKEL